MHARLLLPSFWEIYGAWDLVLDLLYSCRLDVIEWRNKSVRKTKLVGCITLHYNFSLRFQSKLRFLTVCSAWLFLCLTCLWGIFQGSFKVISRGFRGLFKSVSRSKTFEEISKLFQECFKVVWNVFSELLTKTILWYIRNYFVTFYQLIMIETKWYKKICFGFKIQKPKSVVLTLSFRC